MKYEVSVVIPVYNCKNLIRRCVESVLSQKNSEDFQIILIDDGSTDGASEVCDSLSAEHENVFSFHQKNAGVSAARNAGIEKAEGKWISFIDCDDYVLEGFFEKLTEGTDADLLCCDFFDENNNFASIGNFIPEGVHYKQEFGEVLYPVMAEDSLFYSACNKIFKREIIEKNNIRFVVGMKLAEDMTFVFEYVKHIESFKYVQQRLYYYYINDSNTTFVVKKGYEAYKNIYLFKSDYFGFLKSEDVFETLRHSFLDNTVAAICTAANSLKLIEAWKYIKTIIGDALFYDMYRAYRICRCDEMFFDYFDKFLMKKRVVLLIVLSRINELRSKLKRG